MLLPCQDAYPPLYTQVKPGAPEAFCYTVAMAIGHLEPARLTVSGTGSLPSVVLTLGRTPDAAFERCLMAAISDAGLPAAPMLPPGVSSRQVALLGLNKVFCTWLVC